MKKKLFYLLVIIAFFSNVNKSFSQEIEAYVGEIRLVAFNTIPDGWFECNGMELQISSYPALYALLGATYGGNGTTTFALPDLRGRVPVGAGQGAGLTNYARGAKGGYENITISTSQMPVHDHGVLVNTGAGTTNDPSSAYLANTGTLDKEYSSTAGASNTVMVQDNGGGQAHENRPPYLAMKYIICHTGIYPVAK